MKKNRNFTEVLDSFLHDEQFAADFLSQALEEEDFSTFLLSMKDIIRVHGTTKSIAEKAHISRTTLYKLISGNSNPELKTVLALLHTLGYDLRVTKRKTSPHTDAFTALSPKTRPSSKTRFAIKQ
jgi:probable addiction module antidote protein